MVMKTTAYLIITPVIFFLASLIIFLPEPLQAQRMGHGGGGGRGGGGGGARMSSGGGGGGGNRSINGGNRTSTSRPPSNNMSNRQPSGSRDMNAGNRQGNTPNTRDVNSGNRPNSGNRQGNNVNSGNRTNTGNRANTGNININNSRNVNVAVRPNPRPYPRPPYVYGGYRYSCYHPYTPFFWGPAFHPWGFFVATIAVTAIMIDIASQQYYYDQGIYYVQSNGGYTVVQAPPGATVTVLPKETQTVVVNETVNNYYYGGTFYEKSDGGYTVVEPMAGTVVSCLPDGGEEVKVGDITYVKVGNTYYQPIKQDGKDMYEVVDVEADK
jgi:hypothetical protein